MIFASLHLAFPIWALTMHMHAPEVPDSAQVTSLIECIASASGEPLVAYMFEDCQLLQWIVDAKTEIHPDPHPYDTRHVFIHECGHDSGGMHTSV